MSFPPDPRRRLPSAARESWWSGGTHAAAATMPLRRLDLPPAGTVRRGALLFLPGRADFYEKYLETLTGWAEQGWAVTALDWRGQGGSGRFALDPMLGDVPDFALWVADLAAFWRDYTAELAQAAQPAHAPDPKPVVVAHSMGAHLALRALAEGVIAPAALVLTAPMLGFVTPIPRWLQRPVIWAKTRFRNPVRPVWNAKALPGSRRGHEEDHRMALLTHDLDRYADEVWWKAQRPELDLGAASWRWLASASASFDRLGAPGVLEAITTPVLLLGTRDDRLVSWPAIERTAARLPHAELAAWGREAAHELLREADPVRDAVLARIARFLDRHVPAPAALTPRLPDSLFA